MGTPSWVMCECSLHGRMVCGDGFVTGEAVNQRVALARLELALRQGHLAPGDVDGMIRQIRESPLPLALAQTDMALFKRVSAINFVRAKCTPSKSLSPAVIHALVVDPPKVEIVPPLILTEFQVALNQD